jgi:hypothetical protein
MSADDPGALGNGSGDSIDHYLDRLADMLVLRGRSVRRILCESEDHLRASVADAVSSGMGRTEAEEAAIARFGSPSTVARRFAAGENRLPSGLVASVVLSLALMAGIGMVAVGVSGGVAAAMGGVAGKAYVAGDAPGVTYTPERCAEYQRLRPEATTCTGAAVAHHFDEVVGYRLDAGVLGLLIIAGWYVARRRRLQADRTAGLPSSYLYIAGTVLFGAAAAGLTGLGALGSISGGTSGAGDPLSGGLVSAVVAAGFALAMLRSMRTASGAQAERLG